MNFGFHQRALARVAYREANKAENDLKSGRIERKEVDVRELQQDVARYDHNGRFYLGMAAAHYLNALGRGAVADPTVENTASEQLNQIEELARSGGRDQGLQAARKCDFMFCIDQSGSMAGGRWAATVKNFQVIYKDNVRDSDRCGCVTFNTEPTTLFPLLEKKDNNMKILEHFSRIGSPTGGTSFFDAIGVCLDQLEAKVPHADQQWIVALTDGEDNQSRIYKTAEDIRARLSRSGIAGLIILGVGMEAIYEVKMSELVRSTKKGVYVNAPAQGGALLLDQAFKEVQGHLDAGQVAVDEAF